MPVSFSHSLSHALSQWAITSDDPNFKGTGNPDTGALPAREEGKGISALLITDFMFLSFLMLSPAPCAAGEDYGPAPDLDHLNTDLRAALKDWLRWLHEDIGFKGWRLDFVKGYGAQFVPEYVNASLPEGSVCVGEYWSDLKW